MRLYSYHNPEFDLRAGFRLDVKLSPWGKLFDPGLYEKQCGKLAAQLGTDQFLWCVGMAEHGIWIQRTEWAFDIPDNLVLKVLNSYVWCRLINDYTCPHRLWQKAARKRFPNDITNQDKHYAELEKEWKKEKNDEELWGMLFKEGFEEEDDSVLIPYPVAEKYIVKVTPCPYEKNGPELVDPV